MWNWKVENETLEVVEDRASEDTWSRKSDDARTRRGNPSSHPCGSTPSPHHAGFLTSPFGSFTNRLQGPWREPCDKSMRMDCARLELRLQLSRWALARSVPRFLSHGRRYNVSYSGDRDSPLIHTLPPWRLNEQPPQIFVETLMIGAVRCWTMASVLAAASRKPSNQERALRA